MNDKNAIYKRLKEGNKAYLNTASPALRMKTAEEGQHPYAIVICCSDSRVIPERIFSADIGELFVIRVAGNVLDKHQLGSIEYAASHLGTQLILVLGHTGCGAVHAALNGGGDGYIKYITDDILSAIGTEKNPDQACRLNVKHAVDKLKTEFDQHPEIQDVDVCGAVYDICSGGVEWI
jgi:carbonic anhydrase